MIVTPGMFAGKTFTTIEDGVPVQIHGIDAVRALVASTPDAQLFLYPGAGHLFAETGSAGLRSGRRAAAHRPGAGLPAAPGL